jgi:hypothetical protein
MPGRATLRSIKAAVAGCGAAAAILLAGPGGVRADDPVAANSTRSFGQLGWHAPRELSRTSPTTSVAFEMPDSATQGEGQWYALELAFQWTGTPSPGPAYLYAKWNGSTVYQFKAKPVSDDWIDGAFEWSIVDAVSGGAAGTELGGRFDGQSANFATYDAIKPGRNELSLELDLAFASESDVRVAILPESTIISTSNGPSALALISSNVEVGDGQIKWHFRGQNPGIATSSASGQLLLSYVGGGIGRHPVALPQDIASKGEVEGRGQAPLGKDQKVKSATLVLRWSTGEAAYSVYPTRSRTWADALPPLPIVPLLLLSVALIWITTPAFLRTLHQAFLSDDHGRPR